MGWGRMFLLGNIGQQMDLDDLEQEIASLKHRLKAGRERHDQSDRELDRVAAENDELKLYVATILRVLVSKGIVSQRELGELIRSIDAEDGHSDNAYRGSIVPPGDAELGDAAGRSGTS
jgi:hypothetical protein